MIFVTVGTHEEQFNRVVEYMDKFKARFLPSEEVIIQTGYSSYTPKNCLSKSFYSYDEMIRLVDKARIVITHAGPSSIMLAVSKGKVPIVVPRQKKYSEHVNDHQVEFANEMAKRMNSFIVVNEIDMLAQTINEYDKLKKNNIKMIESNNLRFNQAIEKMSKLLVQKKKKSTFLEKIKFFKKSC